MEEIEQYKNNMETIDLTDFSPKDNNCMDLCLEASDRSYNSNIREFYINKKTWDKLLDIIKGYDQLFTPIEPKRIIGPNGFGFILKSSNKLKLDDKGYDCYIKNYLEKALSKDQS